jgi:hypothetical protein
MNKGNDRKDQPGIPEGTGARGGREALKPEQQEAAGAEPDSAVDAKLRESKRSHPGGLNPNTIVRN